MASEFHPILDLFGFLITMASDNCSILINEKDELANESMLLKAYLSKHISSFKQSQSDVDDANRILAKENENFRSELDRVLALNQKLQDQSSKDQEMISRLVCQNQQLEAQLKKCEKENIPQNSDNRQTIQDLKCENQNLVEKNTLLSAQNEGLVSRLSALRTSKREVEQQCETQKAELAVHCDRVNVDLIVLQKSLQGYKDKCSKLTDDYDFMENSNRLLTKKLADFSKQNDNLTASRDRYKRLNNDKISLIKKLKSNEKKLAMRKLRKENASLRFALASERRDRKMMENLQRGSIQFEDEPNSF